MVNYIHKGDIPADLAFSTSVAVDTETTGLKINRDRYAIIFRFIGSNEVVYRIPDIITREYFTNVLCNIICTEIYSPARSANICIDYLNSIYFS